MVMVSLLCAGTGEMLRLCWVQVWMLTAPLRTPGRLLTSARGRRGLIARCSAPVSRAGQLRPGRGGPTDQDTRAASLSWRQVAPGLATGCLATCPLWTLEVTSSTLLTLTAADLMVVGI